MIKTIFIKSHETYKPNNKKYRRKSVQNAKSHVQKFLHSYINRLYL